MTRTCRHTWQADTIRPNAPDGPNPAIFAVDALSQPALPGEDGVAGGMSPSAGTLRRHAGVVIAASGGRRIGADGMQPSDTQSMARRSGGEISTGKAPPLSTGSTA